jgi:hypothetical protein
MLFLEISFSQPFCKLGHRHSLATDRIIRS